MEEVFAQSKMFFDLPHSEKIKLLRDEKNRGYTPMLDEILDPENQVNGDYKEVYYIGVEVPADSPEADRPFYGPNQWPSEGSELIISSRLLAAPPPKRTRSLTRQFLSGL